MSDKLLEQYVRTQNAVHFFPQDVRERMREERGQTTVEWLVIMVGLIALAGVLAGLGHVERRRQVADRRVLATARQDQGQGLASPDGRPGPSREAATARARDPRPAPGRGSRVHRLPRARDARGQTTVEWLAVMVGFVALVTVLAGDDIWARAGQTVVDATKVILGSGDDSV